MVSKRVSASASGSASTTIAGRTKLWVTRPGGIVGGRSQPRGFAAALGRRWRVAHNSTGPTTAEGSLNQTRKRSGLHLMNALLRSWVSGPPLGTGIARQVRVCSLAENAHRCSILIEQHPNTPSLDRPAHAGKVIRDWCSSPSLKISHGAQRYIGASRKLTL